MNIINLINLINKTHTSVNISLVLVVSLNVTIVLHKIGDVDFINFENILY